MKNIHNRHSVKGFTLVEMIIVLAIIAILATVATLSLSQFRRDSMISRANENAKIVGQTIQDWLTQMELDGVQISVDNPEETTDTKYMTITSNRSDGLYADVGQHITLNGADFEQEASSASIGGVYDEEHGTYWGQLGAENTLIVKDYQPTADGHYSDNHHAMQNGLDGKRLTGRILSPTVERNLSSWLKNSEMDAMNHTWLCVIDTESNTVLYTTWLDEIRAAGLTNNEQRYREWPVGSSISENLCQDTFNDTYNRATGCYPLVDEEKTVAVSTTAPVGP